MGSSRAILAVAVLVVCGAALLLLRGRGDGPTDGPGRSQGSGPRGPLAVEGAPPPLAAGPRVPKEAIADDPPAPASDPVLVSEPEPLEPADRPADWPATATTDHRAVRFRVQCVNAATGEKIAVRWRLKDATWVAVPSVRWSDSRWRGGNLVATVFPEPDASIGRWLEIATPAGFLPPTDGRIIQPVASDAQEVMTTVPLWPAFDLELTLRGPDGAPAAGVRTHRFTVAGVRLDGFGGDPDRCPGPSDARGVVRVRGLPFVPGAEVRAHVFWRLPSVGGTTDSEDAFFHDELTDAERARPPIVLKLPDVLTTFVAAAAQVAGPTDGGAGVSPWERASERVPAGPGIVGFAEPEAPGDPAFGRVRVRVRGADGRPIARASVRIRRAAGQTDANGFLELASVVAGARELEVSVPGGFRWTANVGVKAGADVDVEVREPAGGRIDVEVVDGEGHPCPFARIRVVGSTGSATYDVEDGVQRLDDLTDVAGQRSFRRVAPGETSLVAEWRGREGVAKVVVEERGRVTARIVVR